MKAESTAAAALKPSRNTVYSRPAPKRVSSAISQLHPLQGFSPSCGISKSRSKAPAPSPKRAAVQRSPASLAAIELQRQRQQQIIALEREVRGLLEEEYRDDVKTYMHEMELLTMCSPQSIDMQPELQWQMRGCLVEFLIEVHLTFRLRPETLYLTCNIVDRYVSRRVVYKKHYQLVGCAALWIAAKFEDAKERVPTVKELSEICENAYDESAFIQMEGHVLATIAWKVGHPTAEAWLRVACCGMCFEDTQTQHVARFLMEVTLFYREYVQFTPSVIADAALLLARYTLGKARRPSEETTEVIFVVRLLDDHLARYLEDLSQMLVKKYSFSYWSKASTYIIQFYLNGHRYSYIPPVIHSSPLEPPVTPTNKTTTRSLQAWPSASSMSSTPSFTGSDFTDFSSDTDDQSSMPTTPRTPSASAHGTTNVLESFAIHSMTLTDTANKENRPVGPGGVVVVSGGAGMVVGAGHTNGVSASAVALALADSNGGRSRKSSFETARSRKSSFETMDPATAELCGPSPTSREATYIPRAALHSLKPNNGGIDTTVV